MDPVFRMHILERWTQYDVGFDLVIGSFARNGEFHGQAFLLYVSGQEGKIKPVNFPGYAPLAQVKKVQISGLRIESTNWVVQ